MEITANWIDEKWQYNSKFLDLAYFPHPHSGMNIKEYLINYLEENKIEHKMICMVTDNASNMVLAGCLME